MEEQTRKYWFKPFGPFRIPLEGNTVVASIQLKQFWIEMDRANPGLPEAVGCYIFGIKTGRETLPWYVGKTEKRSFRFEASQPHKLRYYEEALRIQPEGIGLLYLIPRMTNGGKFRQVWKDGSSSVERLEGMLIETALSRNPNLRNKRMLKHLTQTVVPGYKNEPPGPRSPEAKHLANLLGVPKRS